MRETQILAQELENIVLSCATGGTGDPVRYRELRAELVQHAHIKDKVPSFLLSCRELDHFWVFIRDRFPTYRERRSYIWSQFAPLLDYLETDGGVPADKLISGTIGMLQVVEVQRRWDRALERRSTDPEGAITAARSLLETVCKCILDKSKIEYPRDADLPKLYKTVARDLSLAPSGELDHVYNQILGGCSAVIEGIGALRNRLGDAHGKGTNSLHTEGNDAELAVNLAGAMALFLMKRWQQDHTGADAP